MRAIAVTHIKNLSTVSMAPHFFGAVSVVANRIVLYKKHKNKISTKCMVEKM